MRVHTLKKSLFRFRLGIILMLLLIAESGITRAIGGPLLSISLAFDQTIATVGRTPLLTIDISSSDMNAIRVTSLTCTSYGNSLTHNSINPLPSTIPANGFVRTHQLYRANTPGVTQVTCAISGVDTVSGAAVGATSLAAGVNVLSETRLYFDATSATKIATVGQMVYIIAKFGNRGSTPFTNANLSCVEFGRALENISSPPVPSTILPGQSSFVQQQWRAARTGAGPISCQLSATDSSGIAVTLPSPTINIEVR